MNENQEIQYIEAMRKGKEAQEVLEHPLIKNFFEETEKEIFEQWKNINFEEKEMREELYRRYKTLEKFELYFKQFIEGGKTAETLLEKIKEGIKKIF